MPKLGLVRAAILFGIINAGGGAVVDVSVSRPIAVPLRVCARRCVAVLLLLGGGMVASNWIQSAADNQLYADEVIFERNTRYQRIVVTKWKDDLRLFLNSHLQFSSRDEYRYHEALVHPGLSALPDARRALVLGGGDGLAVRELLKYPNLESITLVDLDPRDDAVVHRASHAGAAERVLFQQSARARDQRRTRFHGSIEMPESWDFIVVDFPDPTNYSLGKLYTTCVLPPAEQARQRERAGGGPEHVADVFAAVVLVHRRYAEAGRIPHLAVSRLRAELRGVGLHAGREMPGNLLRRCPRACDS